MGKADNLMLGLNTIAGGTAGGELNLMVKSIRELAEDFDKRSGALMTDGRRTLADISRAVNNFDRNPSRVIFGGSNNAAPAEAAAASRPAGRRQQLRRRRRAGRSGNSRPIGGSDDIASLGHRRERARNRHCARSEAVAELPAWSFVIASSLCPCTEKLSLSPPCTTKHRDAGLNSSAVAPSRARMPCVCRTLRATDPVDLADRARQHLLGTLPNERRTAVSAI